MKNNEIVLHFKDKMFRQIHGAILWNNSINYVLSIANEKIKTYYPNADKDFKQNVFEITKALYYLAHKIERFESIKAGAL